MEHGQNLTLVVSLSGGQDRLRQLIFYVCEKCQAARRFGKVKLNKIIWRADFRSFAARRIPITGRAYQRLALGPAPKEMLPLLRDMERIGDIHFQKTDFGDDVVEFRPVTTRVPDISMFSSDDMEFVNEAIIHYWSMSGTETSDESHGVAWKTRVDKDPMPYELAYLSDKPLSGGQLAHLVKLAQSQGWSSY